MKKITILLNTTLIGFITKAKEGFQLRPGFYIINNDQLSDQFRSALSYRILSGNTPTLQVAREKFLQEWKELSGRSTHRLTVNTITQVLTKYYRKNVAALASIFCPSGKPTILFSSLIAPGWFNRKTFCIKNLYNIQY